MTEDGILSAAEADAAWNRRAANAALAARCEELQAGIDEIASCGVEGDFKGMRYITVQISRSEWARLQALASQAEGERADRS
jgi:hypothetical protein